MTSTPILAHLYDLLGRVVLLPIPKGEKGPTIPGWQKLTFEDTQTPQYQKMLETRGVRGGNIGALLGPVSDGLFSIDIDQDVLVDSYLAINPILAATTRTRGKR